jgi:hypothetical protein
MEKPTHQDPPLALLRYEGAMNTGVRVQLLDLLHAGCGDMGQAAARKRALSVALELLDNAKRYGTSAHVEFLWQRKGHLISLSVTNRASQRDALRLERIVAEVAAMGIDNVKDAFKRQLMDEGYGEKGGAGLGFLQIARKEGAVLKAHIRPITADEFICTSEVQMSWARA